MEAALKIFRKNKIAYFTDPGELVKALDYFSFVKKFSVEKKEENVVVNQLSFARTQQLLQEVGLSTSGIFVQNKNELAVAVGKIAGPYALKVMTDKVLHKSDVGGVKLNLNNLAEVTSAWEEIVKNILSKTPEIKIEGMLLQPMTEGREVIIGMKRDATFGPTMVFGLGGVFVEVLKDVSMRVAPLSETDVQEMTEEIKGANVLYGVRGQKEINFDALKKVILAVAKLAIAHPEIKEVDLNPVMCDETGVNLVDVRMM